MIVVRLASYGAAGDAGADKEKPRRVAGLLMLALAEGWSYYVVV